MSRKLLTAVTAFGCLSCLISVGCCHLGGCHGGKCAGGACKPKAYGKSEYVQQFAEAPAAEDEAEYDGAQVSYSEPVPTKRSQPAPTKRTACQDGNCRLH